MNTQTSTRALLALAIMILSSAWGKTPESAAKPKSTKTLRLIPPLVPKLEENSPLQTYADFWRQAERTGQTGTEPLRQARHILYRAIANQKTLTAEQKINADLISLHLAHATLMENARRQNTDTGENLNRTLWNAARLKNFRRHFKGLTTTTAQTWTELTEPDPFALELEIAMENTTLIRKVTEPWKTNPTDDANRKNPATTENKHFPEPMLRLSTTIVQPGSEDEKIFLVLHSVPHNATVCVDGLPQTKRPLTNRCSFRVPLVKAFPEQKKFNIDIHIPHPPQNLKLKAAWLVKQNK